MLAAAAGHQRVEQDGNRQAAAATSTRSARAGRSRNWLHAAINNFITGNKYPREPSTLGTLDNHDVSSI